MKLKDLLTKVNEQVPLDFDSSKDGWDEYEAVNDPASGKKLPNEGHAKDDDWDDYEAVNDPASGKKLPNEGHASDDDWDDFEAVNDPASGKKLPNEGHAKDDDWDDFEAVNDPASGKKLPNEGHASDDDWDDFEAVNDPASGKKLPNEGHAYLPDQIKQLFDSSGKVLDRCIYVTEQFKKEIEEIYGSFSRSDDEYPAMGITIQGAPIFVECVQFPDCAVTRRRMTDEVKREHPAVGELWQNKLRQYDGKCRTSTVHIHPMNFPSLSGTDISNFDSLRRNPDDPSTFNGKHPYPVVLVNLNAEGTLDLLGFWVTDGQAHQVNVELLKDKSPIVDKAWSNAEKMAFFSDEGNVARRINRLVSKDWDVELGENRRTGAKALKAKHANGQKVLVKFNTDTPLGLSAKGGNAKAFHFEEYVDWTRIFNDLAVLNETGRRKRVESVKGESPSVVRTETKSKESVGSSPKRQSRISVTA